MGGDFLIESAPGDGTRLESPSGFPRPAQPVHDSPDRVLIADDHPIVRDGLYARILTTQPDITVVGQADLGDEAVRQAEEASPT